MKRSASILGLLFVAACATQLTPAGAKVRITTNPDVVKGCRFVANVRATGANTQSMFVHAGAAPNAQDVENVQKKLQNETARLGGDTVFLSKQEGTSAIGEAYRCAD